MHLFVSDLTKGTKHNTADRLIEGLACISVGDLEMHLPWQLEQVYELSWHSKATPRLIQCSCGLSEGRVIAITKLVEWPVVDRTPLLSLVLYTGAR